MLTSIVCVPAFGSKTRSKLGLLTPSYTRRSHVRGLVTTVFRMHPTHGYEIVPQQSGGF